MPVGPSTSTADDSVGAVLAALADPTRRAVFETVARNGPLTATALAADLPVTRQAVTKHLERLADAALVRSARAGRETRWSATPESLADTRRWLDDVGAAWDRRLAALAAAAQRGRQGRAR